MRCMVAVSVDFVGRNSRGRLGLLATRAWFVSGVKALHALWHAHNPWTQYEADITSTVHHLKLYHEVFKYS